jgi:methionyl-tRNA synthetase
MGDTFFITTAIDYTNAAPHIGHAYEKILADVLARYHRLKGDNVFFLTGVDQHGQKVQQSAEKQGIAPQEFVDGVTAKFRALWEKLEIRYDRWAATTEQLHKTCVQKILTRINAEGQIYKAKRAGYYSVRQEQFLTDKERNEQGEFGPEWGQVEFREEENYYFRLAEHRQWLLDLIDKRSAAGRPLVTPDFRVAELRNAVERLEGDLCISRPKARLAWGIPIPFDEEFVTFVWFDALVNYISFAPGYDPAFGAALTEFKIWWPALHVIGKDIMIPAHGVYWPIMLKALGFSEDEIPPLLVHGWWNVAGAKMSKTLGNVVDPNALADKYGAETLRYYLMSDIATGRDADFSEERLVQRYNTDLANSLGNLLNRTLSMAGKYRSGNLRYGCKFGLELGESDLKALLANFPLGPGEIFVGNYAEYFETHRPSVALEHTWDAVSACNALIDATAPWKLAKDPDQADRLDAVLYQLAESLRIIAILISPVLPKAAEGIFAQLNWNRPMTLSEATWGKLPDGHQLGAPTPLFPRLELQTE